MEFPAGHDLNNGTRFWIDMLAGINRRYKPADLSACLFLEKFLIVIRQIPQPSAK